ncbi:MAG: pyruvate ferredoxin oxidoreductase [Elusimicrobia bacterium RIFCSPHIGHO2_02_FULL_57_9]|nr:MAG: pyruvate ferredoxin oxidoreductase [Elusimicrobia bacterium RIFCSPHIGHO2_02_FULL_57_9]
MRKVLMGNHCAAVAAALAKVDVVSAYPITPQTQSVELLAEMEASGRFKGRFMRVESEHSAMAELLGAATAGARTFTSTSSQGLAYMHELLHWVSGARLPVVMVEVNRALAAPWNLWADQTDSLSQRDTGWMQFYCSDNQEILDTVLLAYRIAEQAAIPAMVVFDGFVLSHTYEAVDVPAQEDVDRFLPPYQPRQQLDVKRPLAFGSLTGPRDYIRLRRRLDGDLRRSIELVERAGREFERIFGRRYGLWEEYRCEDAEALLVASGAPGSTAKEAVDALRARGRRAGLLRLRAFRPFPAEALRRFVKAQTPLAVVDRNCSPGTGGIFFQEIKAALYPHPAPPPVYGFIAGLGGGDITQELLEEIWLEAADKRAEPGAARVEPVWMEDPR